MKKGILKKVFSGVFGIAITTGVVSFFVFAGRLIKSNHDLHQFLDEYEETKICQQLKEEEIEWYTDAFKRGLITEEELEQDKKMIKSYSRRELEKYIKINREENTQFRPTFENLDKKSRTDTAGLLGSLVGTFLVCSAASLDSKINEAKKKSQEETIKTEAKEKALIEAPKTNEEVDTYCAEGIGKDDYDY